MDSEMLLNNGVKMPRVGLGTFRAKSLEVQRAVAWATEAKIRLIDTASIYKNESDICSSLAASSASSQVFLTSKISPYEQGTEAAARAFEAITYRLGRVDLLLIHWPGAAKVKPDSLQNTSMRHETWRVLERLYMKGRVRAIGVSNFTVAHLQQLLDIAAVRPAVNQVEVHPRYPQPELLEFCAQQGIAVTAYGSLGSGDSTLLNDPRVQSIADSVRKSPAQVLLRWGLQKGCAVIPKSVRRERILEFSESELLSWELSEAQMAVLDGIPKADKHCWDPRLIA